MAALSDPGPNTRFTTLVARIEGALASRWLPAWLAVVAVLLLLPALGGGFQLDDWFHRLRLLGFGNEPAIQLFRFYDGDPAKNLALMDGGYLPWWTAPNLRHSSLRYLSVLTMQLDYLLWPNRPWLMHAHSLFWLGALVAATTLLYRRLLVPGWVAGLAALLYAVDDAHAAPTAYIANRNAVIATCFGVLCLLCFVRERQQSWQPGRWLSPLLLALALAAGEIALATAAYLAAYAIFVDRAPLRRRLAALVPNGATLAVWAAVYAAGGFGSEGSGFYVDPHGDPRAFVAALLARGPILLLGQWTPLPADLGSVFAPGTELARGLLVAALGVLVVVAFLLWPLLRSDRVARFWCLGSLSSLVPIAAVGPQNRLLFFVGLGAMALLAQAVALAGSDGARAQSRIGRLARLNLAALLLLVHAVAAPITTWLAAGDRSASDRMSAGIASVPDDPAIARQDLVLLNPPDSVYLVTAIPVVKTLQGAPAPARVLALANGAGAMRVARIDDRALRVELPDGLFPTPFSRYHRSADLPFAVGQRVELTRFSVEIAELGASGDPTALVFRFGAPLEDPSMRWLRWDGERYVAWRPPAAGESVTVPPVRGLFL